MIFSSLSSVLRNNATSPTEFQGVHVALREPRMAAPQRRTVILTPGQLIFELFQLVYIEGKSNFLLMVDNIAVI